MYQCNQNVTWRVVSLGILLMGEPYGLRPGPGRRSGVVLSGSLSRAALYHTFKPSGSFEPEANDGTPSGFTVIRRTDQGSMARALAMIGPNRLAMMLYPRALG